MGGITFIHGADLHLDSPMVGLRHLPQGIFHRLKESTFQALEALVTEAIAHSVDFVILAGDLFDQENRSIRAQIRLKKEMERLEAANIPVFVVHGNHDSLNGKFPHLDLPANVSIFTEQVEVKQLMTNQGVLVHLYGFSYATRHVTERKIADYVKKDGADYHIGILHGNLEGNTDHGNYAPFSLPELLGKDFDYWALGHIHKRQVVTQTPPVVYPGNTQGRNRKEVGEKGVYIVQLQNQKAHLSFVPTANATWLERKMDADDITTFDDLYIRLQKLLEEEREDGRNKLISVEIEHVSPGLIDARQQEELLESLQDAEQAETPFIWIYQLAFQEKLKWNREELSKSADFYGELFGVVDQYSDIKQSLSSLYQHSSAKRLLSDLTESEQREMLREAEETLVELLLKE